MDITGNIRYMHDTSDQLPDLLRRRAEACFAAEEAEKRAALGDRAAFEARRRRVRERFVASLGGLDLPRTPLGVRITGILRRERYEIRKLIFESRPGFHVTCNLYVPHDITAPAPGVLFLCGHSDVAKAHSVYQKCCIDLACQGLVVLAMDCVGQGERYQYVDPQSGRQWVRCGTYEHSYAGLQFSLTGGSIAQVFVWDAMRALDVLSTLDFVDPGRLGVTGNSGGGTQTSYMMMADDRVAAAAPCCYLTSREEYMKTGQSHDSEQNLYGAIAEGLNNDDYVLAFAPKPLLIGDVDSDFFAIEGVEKTYARGRRAYALYGREGDITLKIGAGTHGLIDELRTAVVNFFRRVFLGLPQDFVTDPDMKTETPEDLRCLPHGQVLRDIPGEATVSDLTAARVRAAVRSPLTAQGVREAVTEFFSIPRDRAALKPRILGAQPAAVGSVSPVFFFSEPDIIAAGAWYRGDEPARRLTVYLSLEGTPGYVRHHFAILEHLEAGDVLDFDPRAIGSVRARDVNHARYEHGYGTLFKLNCDAIMLGTSLMAMQLFDAVRAVDLARQLGYEEIVLAGDGYGALLALLAAAATDNRAVLDNPPSSFAEIASARMYAYHPLLEVYGLLNALDVPDLIKAMGDRVRVRSIPGPGTGMI